MAEIELKRRILPIVRAGKSTVDEIHQELGIQRYPQEREEVLEALLEMLDEGTVQASFTTNVAPGNSPYGL